MKMIKRASFNRSYIVMVWNGLFIYSSRKECLWERPRLELRATGKRVGKGWWGGWSLACPFLKIEKNVPWFGAIIVIVKHRHCVHLLVKCLIWNAVIRASRKKLQKFCLPDISFMCLRQNIYRSAPIPRNPGCPERVLVVRLPYFLITSTVFLKSITKWFVPESLPKINRPTARKFKMKSWR